MFNNVLALDISAVLAAVLTSVWVIFDFLEAAERITALLKRSLECPSAYLRAATWSTILLDLALEAWLTDMINHGHDGTSSFCTWDDGVLHITAGFLEEAETTSTLYEYLLYHSTRALLKYGNAHAIQSEHFVSGTEDLSKRIDFELAARRTFLKVLRHLCLDVDVDSCWEDLPPATRRAILCRVAGRHVSLCMEFSRWMEAAQIDRQTIDFHLDLALGIYQRTLQRPHAPITESLSRFSLYSDPEVVKPFAKPDAKESIFWRMTSFLIHVPITTKVCWLIKNAWVDILIIYHRSTLAHISRLARKGASRVLKKNIIVVELPRRVVTGFVSRNDQGTLTLNIFPGRIDTPPPNEQPLSIAVYDEHLRLKSRTDAVGTIDRICTYEYDDNYARRWPRYKQVVQGSTSIRYHYDGIGRISHSTLTLASDTFVFQYGYKGSPARGDSPAKWTKCDWVPSDRVCCVIRFVNGKTYITTWEFLHRRDPIINSYLHEGDIKTVVTNVPRVFDQEDALLIRPTNVNFDDDDLLVHHRPRDLQLAASATNKASFVSRLNPLGWPYGLQKARYRRNHWLTAGNVDAVTACWMDEVILREEPLLKGYWRARDLGRLGKAKKALDDNIEQIVAAIEIEREVSEMCLLPIKAADLYVIGQSKDANQITNRPQDCYLDTDNQAPGGVSNYRRDLINGHIEKSVQSLKLLPLWGVDGKTPNHGVIDNLLQSQVDDKIRITDTRRDIIKTFVPLIKLFVRGARTKAPSRTELQQYSQVFIALSNYFENKDYNTTWQSKEVMGAWVEAWLTPYHNTNVREPATSFDVERPSMNDFQDALAIYSSYFFIFSVEVPEDCPRYRRGVTFGIWDHAILWRECCLNISPAQSSLSIPVQSMLLAGIGLATRLAYFHADVILPCTSVFNPIWEAELGTDSGRLIHRNQFSRKIDPIVNGISDMESFRPTDKVESNKPTVVMLSNVQFIKDIKTALIAADIIVNKFGFCEYKLLIYGAQDRQPAYAIEMSKLVTAYNLSDHVSLAGFASSQEVLRSAWLFMNSSISEGLPLAIGEAALAGVPIVATEVGSTALVLTDPDDESLRYGEVVPPNDPMALARAQISILAMVGPWSRFTRDGPAFAASRASRHAVVLPDSITAADVEWLTRRMYERADDRRRLGLRARDVVLRSFHGNRYLREHEQMYWIQWHMAKMRADGSLSHGARGLRYVRSQPMLRYSRGSEGKANEEHSQSKRKHLRWQDFPTQEKRVGKKLRKKHRDELAS
ncbi:hypothetical protein B0T26DRAFT_787683 [Lasiosphaeria miniovina]|uniref:Glycosyl transferase family 1 domain-containing protein n=1 Tax=Lasiosphaeria miniovina TaxID=1954250 RepID=A0AA40A6S1_9PEZI|nr:uncharacterized protein B0T26DRAFT_787683 [Lasiosphaeria miniovina]KAK0710262.1 hypothetical protein B0T26DRAFT_787683 [Lasiosphaeria miniovina]